MSFFSALFGKGRKKQLVDLSITQTPSSPAQSSQPETEATVLRRRTLDPAPDDPAMGASWQAKKVAVWQPGDVILDHYDVEHVITSGGMGRIYVAHHRNWKVKVAIKSPT
jgi:hypothetical protein